MARAALLFLALLAVFACASDEETPPGQYGQMCDMANPCAQGLMCLNRFCSVRCDNALVCQQAGTGDVCVGAACFTSCQDSYTCPQGLTCTMAGSTMGTCRPSP